MNEEIKAYNDNQAQGGNEICNQLAAIIDSELTEAESKVWHRHRCGF